MTKLLYVEDNPDNVYMLTRRLEKRGYTVHVADDGEIGYQMAVEELPDLVIMDLLLPGMDGWEVTAALKANEKTRHIPVIALSSSAMEVDQKRAIESGCDAFESKPVDLKKLLETIEALLGRKSTNV